MVEEAFELIIQNIDIIQRSAINMSRIRTISPQRQMELKNVEIKYDTYPETGVQEPQFNTLNHWNNEEWFGLVCMVYGTGKYRFNQYGTDGFAHWQYRFTSKDAAIEFLCRAHQRLVQVFEGDGQYEVRQNYMEGY